MSLTGRSYTVLAPLLPKVSTQRLSLFSLTCRARAPRRKFVVQIRGASGSSTTQKPDGVQDEGAAEARSRQVALRLKEIQQLNVGESLYPPVEEPESGVVAMSLPNFRATFSARPDGETAVALRGRILSIRSAGTKLIFLDLAGDSSSVQVLCNWRVLSQSATSSIEEFRNVSKLLNRGDVISVEGRPIRTQRGELSIEATRLPKLLSPSLLPLPEKLIDEEVKAQHRHVDMLVNPSTVQVIQMRSVIIKFLRDFFHDRNFLEVQTPILSSNASGAAARPFTTRAVEFSSTDLALRIAPELWLKRLVVGGLDKVFEIGPAFRNEGIDQTHNPEFTICEFYSAYSRLSELMHMTTELVSRLAHHCQEMISTRFTALPPIDTEVYQTPFTAIEFIPSLEAALKLSLPDLSADDALPELHTLLTSHDIPFDASTPLPKLLDKLCSTYLEPRSATSPLYITHHPACMSPLARSYRDPSSGQVVSARAELFVGGREVANMYEEENDPFEQRRKFALQAGRHRDHAEGEAVGVDESYLEALEAGLPPTGGWGCGVERLVMLFSGARRISDCLSFGNLRHVTALGSAARRKEA